MFMFAASIMCRASKHLISRFLDRPQRRYLHCDQATL